MKNYKTLKIIIAILAIVTLVNIVTIVHVSGLLNAPLTNTKTEVFGAVIIDDSPENTIDINLIRPPRVAVKAGDTVNQNANITNTSDLSLYFRCIYKIYIEDKNGNMIENLSNLVDIKTNDNWVYEDGYWYYTSSVMPTEKIPSPVESITYSEKFSNYIGYKIYIPLIVESVETCNIAISEVNYWPQNDINKVDYKRLNESANWTTTVTFDLF